MMPYDPGSSQAAAMYTLYQAGFTMAEVASEYGIHRVTLSRLFKRYGWHVKSRGRPQERWTYCHRGHEFNEENTYVGPDGRRMCRPCSTQRQRDRRERIRRHSTQ